MEKLLTSWCRWLVSAVWLNSIPIILLVECQYRDMFGREMEKREEKTRPNSKFSTLSNPNVQGALCKASAHQKGLREFLSEVQNNQSSFEQWIFMIRKDDFPDDTDIGTKSIQKQSLKFELWDEARCLKPVQTT